MRIVFGMALLIVGMLSSSTAALAYSQSFFGETCNGCTIAQYRNSAIMQGLGEKYVGDFQSGVLKKFLVSREPGGNGQYTYNATVLSVEADHLDAFLRAKSFWDANGHSLVYRAHLQASGTIDGPMNAFDVVDPGAARNSVSAFLGDWNNWRFDNLVYFNFQSYASAFLAFRTGTSISVTVTVSFDDGSQADYQFTYSNNTWSYVNGTAVDSHGNPIPQSVSDIVRTPGGTQTYDYRGPGNPNDANDALNRFNQLGIPISPGVIWACVTLPAPGGVHCTHPF